GDGSSSPREHSDRCKAGNWGDKEQLRYVGLEGSGSHERRRLVAIAARRRSRNQMCAHVQVLPCWATAPGPHEAPFFTSTSWQYCARSHDRSKALRLAGRRAYVEERVGQIKTPLELFLAGIRGWD